MKNLAYIPRIAEPIAANWPSDGQAPAPQGHVGRRGKIPGDIMSGYTIVGLIGFGTCIAVAFLLGAWVG